MAKLALYQKYRSSTFEEVVGQEYIVRSIKNAVRENKVGHAYLFCGPRGTGKTTMARLLAKAVNCTNPKEAPCEKCENCIAANNGTHPDIIEINAANETHVEDIRDLIERSRLAPMQGKHKVYIIDEVHQLSSAASSALLKTLEEPPENVIFILATTDPQKLLPTIISRCQRFDFSKVKTEQIQQHLLNVASKEGIKMEEDAAQMIAILSDGGMRDALSIMDQCASYTSDNITVEDIDRIYGLTTVSEKVELLKDIFQKDLPDILQRVTKYEENGIDFTRYIDGMIDILKDIVIFRTTKNESLLKAITVSDYNELSEIADNNSCMHVCEKLVDTKTKFRFSTSAARLFEVTCLALTVETTQTKVEVIQPTIKKEPFPTTPSIPVEEATKEEPVVTETIEKISTDKILSILVSCDKESKAHDDNTWMLLKNHTNLSTRKYTTLLNDTKIAASGKDCILLMSDKESVVNRINSKKMNEELYFFMKREMNTDKVLFAVTDNEFKNATNAFREAMNNNSLPSKIQVIKYEEKTQEAQASTEDKVKELFGAENVEVI